MAKGEQRSNREAKKPKKEKIKVIAAAPSQKGAGVAADLGFRQKEIDPSNQQASVSSLLPPPAAGGGPPRCHCERSEAIHASAQGKMDCFAALAMTVGSTAVQPFVT